MSTHPLMLEGQVDNRDETIAQLRLQVRRLEEALRLERNKVGQMESGIRELTRTLNPLYRALKSIYGDIEATGIQDMESPLGGPQASGKWEFWKKRFGGRIAETIDLLLVQGQMNTTQLKSALKCDPRTLTRSVIYPLNSAGLLIKNGGMLTLKQL